MALLDSNGTIVKGLLLIFYFVILFCIEIKVTDMHAFNHKIAIVLFCLTLTAFAAAASFPYPLGLLPTTYDSRDLIYDDIIAADTNRRTSYSYPSSFEHDMRKVRDQGSQGSCVGMSLAAMKEKQEQLDIGFNEYMSPQYIYNQRDGYPSSSGMNFREAFDIVKAGGVVPESYYPYGSTKSITSAMRTVAKNYKIDSYASIRSIEALKDAIYNNGPAIIGVPCYDSDARMWHPKSSSDRIEGYHAMTVVGYTTQGFKIRNSWGTSWNGDGHTFLSNGDFDEADSWWTSIDGDSGGDVDPPPTPPPTPVDSGQWYLASRDQSCTSLCRAKGLVCNANTMNRVTSSSGTSEVANELGVRCSSYNNWEYSMNPAQCVSSKCCSGGCVDTCTYGGGDVNCDSHHEEFERFCACDGDGDDNDDGPTEEQCEEIYQECRAPCSDDYYVCMAKV